MRNNACKNVGARIEQACIAPSHTTPSQHARGLYFSKQGLLSADQMENCHRKEEGPTSSIFNTTRPQHFLKT